MRVTLTAPPAPAKDPVNLRLEGRAVIQGREARRPGVPADDMMQAFYYHHLVPAKLWLVTITGRGAGKALLRLVGERNVRIPSGSTAQVRISAPKWVLKDPIQLALSDPPEGIAIQKVTPGDDGISVLLGADAAKVKPGLQGNLIVEAFAERAVQSKDGKQRAIKRRVPLGALPAIPFEVVARP